ncbi:hypothetical protein DKM44_02290 [Deinococcus irradiatisoli]|uniref:Uncharacterized protein n=1 Tax=Deinococcus irradiatisoli TaxID=2202254 RepID=A0A2Z3JAS4_9DEIO|nr:hypothetical protein [Deinococcus irradiatisoli]AWN22207.1 hypothetical protein DKM44_02290 [Deinococcus irradiatisoli]
MADLVKITALGQTYRSQGKRYGPFTATAETPFLEVPEGLALATGAPIFDGEVEPEVGAEIQELLDANNSLETALDKANDELSKVTAERDDLQRRLQETEAQLRYMHEDVLPEAKRQQEADRARIAELEAAALPPVIAEPATTPEAGSEPDDGAAKPAASKKGSKA